MFQNVLMYKYIHYPYTRTGFNITTTILAKKPLRLIIFIFLYQANTLFSFTLKPNDVASHISRHKSAASRF